MCGRSVRFKNQGIYTPKSLIRVGDKDIIQWSFDSINLDNFDPVFILREDDCKGYNLDKILLDRFGGNAIIVSHETKGAVDSCMQAVEFLDCKPLTIFTLDVYFEPKFPGFNAPLDGLLLTFSSSSTNYSYAKTENGLVTEVAEKRVISNNANAGIYCFKSGRLFMEAAKDYTVSGEMHIAPIYNVLINNGCKVGIQEVDTIYIMGTPEEAEFVESVLIDKTRPIGVVSDHSGFTQKELFIKLLEDKGYTYIDFGCFSSELCDYSDFVPNSCKAIKNGSVSYVFGFCRSGQGMNIAANKQSGIRAALIYDPYTALYAVKHNGANFFSIPARTAGYDILEGLLNMIFTTDFQGGRHQGRLMKV